MSSKRLLVGLVCALGLPLASVEASIDLVTNGSFEDGWTAGNANFVTLGGGSQVIPGWTVTGASIDWVNTYWTAADGTKSIDLAGSGYGGITATTQLATTVGQEYLLSFAMSGNPERTPVLKTMYVTIDGHVNMPYSYDTTGHSRPNIGWTYYSLTFVADSTLTPLSFVNEQSGSLVCGVVLDDVSVVAIPEPATILIWALLGFGSAGWSFFWYRRGRGLAIGWSEENHQAIHAIIQRAVKN